MNTLRLALFLAVSILPSHSFAQPETPIPRSTSGDKGKYFLLSSKRTGDVVAALHKRVGVDSIGYTKTQINCKTMLMREMGYSEESPAKIKDIPTKWFEVVPGSSKSDLAAFVCKHEQRSPGA